MRAGLVIYGALESISGGYLYDRKLVDYLERQGDRVEIISLPWRNYASHLADNLSDDIFNRLKNLSVDVLLEDELNHPSLRQANLRLRQRENRFPIISIVHHLRASEQRPAWQNRFYAWIERRYLETLDAFIFNSLHTSQAVKSLLRWDPLSIVALPAGDRFNPRISTAEITDRQMQPGALRLIFLGNLIARKGLHHLLKALAELPAGTWELDVIGSPKSEPAYALRMQNLTGKLGISSRVHFWGKLADDELADHLRRSQLLVMPSSHEGYGIVYLEGMSFGLPAIAGSLGAAGEIITHGHNGWLVDPNDPTELRMAIGRLMEDRDLLLKFSLAALERYQSQPTWEQTAGQIRNFLLSMVNTERSS